MTPYVSVGASWPAWRHGIIAGLALALLGSVLTLIPRLEPPQETFDLWFLFQARGIQRPPGDIVLVTIDRQSADRMALPSDPAARDRCADLRVGAVPPSHDRLPPPHLVMRWPRCVHALAVRALAAAGARVIALDISFRPLPPAISEPERRLVEEQDRSMAAAIASAGNVLIARWLDTDTSGEQADVAHIYRPAQITPVIEAAALGVAPLRLAYGGTGRVNGFAAFSEQDGPISSLPAMALHLIALDTHPDLVRLIAKVSPDNASLLPASADELLQRKPLQATSLLIRHLVRSEPDVAAHLHKMIDGEDPSVAAENRASLRALYDLYSGDPIRYLNFYGPPGTFENISYADIIGDAQRSGEETGKRLAGKTVVVGYVDFTPAQRDDHYSTVYTTEDGVKLSGAEILATAIANLENRTAIRTTPVALRVLIAASFGMALGLVLLVPSPLRGLIGSLAFLAGYLTVTLLAFRAYVWLPVLIPAVLQWPLGVVYAIAHHYLELRRRRDELRMLFGNFVPDALIDEMLQHRARLDSVNDPVYSVCLATDADRFTTLAESMHPSQLARFLNRYFEVVLPRITGRGGKISDLIGDAVLALWTGEDASSALHTKVCAAALELMSAVEHFNLTSHGARLPTRIGISSGPVTTTAIGATSHYEFRPVGETVVTSVRMQDLNKLLGTRILACEPVIRDVDTFLVRDVGVFLLRGKAASTHIFELLGERESASAELMQLCVEFASALGVLRDGGSDDALERFRAIRKRYPEDGPTAFYVRWLSSHPMWGAAAIPQS